MYTKYWTCAHPVTGQNRFSKFKFTVYFLQKVNKIFWDELACMLKLMQQEQWRENTDTQRYLETFYAAVTEKNNAKQNTNYMAFYATEKQNNQNFSAACQRSAVNVLSQEVYRTQDQQWMSYPRKYTGHRIGSECLIPGSIPDTGSAGNVLSQEVYRTQDQQWMSYPRKHSGHRITQ